MKFSRAMEQEGYDIHDYTSIDFTDVEQAYVVGMNMYGTLLALQPNVDLNPKLKALQDNPDLRLPTTARVPGFTAHEELFYANQNCYIYMIQPGMLLTTRLPVLLLANAFYTFHSKVSIIYVIRDPAIGQDGTLYAWFEG